MDGGFIDMSGENLQKGTSWVADLSRLTLNIALSYVVMLKEKGKALLDSEINWMQLLTLAKIRQIGQVFIGDGSPDQGFLIVGTGAVNDFTIKAGNYNINGWIINLAADTSYSAQPVAPPNLIPPLALRFDNAYLDVWLDEVDENGDASIVDPTLQIRTSTRLKLKWMVRVAEGTGVPNSGYGANNLYHWYSPLAVLNRNAIAEINANMVADARGVNNAAFPSHKMATAQNDFLVASGPGAWVKKSLLEVKAIFNYDANYEPKNANLTGHLIRSDNPHNVTALQTGAATAGHNHNGVYLPVSVSGAIPYTTSETGLRIVRGRISGGDGSVLSGAGFGGSRQSVGNYTITFNPAFSAPPVVILSANLGRGASQWTAPTANSAAIYVWLAAVGGQVGSDANFDFIAIGPN
jgi:hypothetical protein